MNIIKDFRPSHMYYHDGYPNKDMIVLHTTTGYGNAGARDWLRISTARQLRTSQPYCIGVHYYLGRNGEVLQDIPENGWAFHSASGRHNDKRSIAIEIANLTVFNKRGSDFIDIYGNIVDTKKYKIYDNGVEWRGYRYYEAFPKKQIEVLIELVNDILRRNPSIPRLVPTINQFFPAQALPYNVHSKMQGIACHTHFIGPPKKQDMPKSFKPYYNQFVSECGLAARNIY